MRKVTIEYQPFRRLRYKRFFTGNFPSEWSKTNPKQLIAIACLMKSSISDVQFLSIMTGLSERMIGRLDDYQRFQLIELFDSFHSDKPYNEFIIDKLDCNFVGSGLGLDSGCILVHPKPKLAGVTFGQFIFMDTYFANYQESSDVNDLNRFIAATYIPSGRRFIEHFIEANHKSIGKTDLLTREAIVINYHLIRDWLCTVYPMVFQKQSDNKKSTDAENVAKQKPVPKRDPNSWIKVFDGLVGDDIVNEDNYANLPVHNVLRHLTNRIKTNPK
jgi:hypothetical protein